MPEPEVMWAVAVERPLDPDVVDQLREELGIEFFGLNDAHESTVGQRILERGAAGTSALLVRRWIGHGGYSFELLSSFDATERSGHERLHRRCLAIAADHQAEVLPSHVFATGQGEHSTLEVVIPEEDREDYADAIVTRERLRAESRLAALGEELVRLQAIRDVELEQARAALRAQERVDTDDAASRTRQAVRGVSWVLGDAQPVTLLARFVLLALAVAQYFVLAESLSPTFSPTVVTSIALAGAGLAAAVGSTAGQLQTRRAAGDRRSAPIGLVLSAVTLVALLTVVWLSARPLRSDSLGSYQVWDSWSGVMFTANLGLSLLIALDAFFAYRWSAEASARALAEEHRRDSADERLREAMTSRLALLNEYLARAEAEIPRFRTGAFDAVTTAFGRAGLVPPFTILGHVYALEMPGWVERALFERARAEDELADLRTPRERAAVDAPPSRRQRVAKAKASLDL